MSVLELADVNVHYGTFHAVKQVGLRVEAGEIVALLGGSGSGKSSLLRAIAGLEQASGILRFAGQDLQDIPVHRRGFGLMFQDGQLFGHRSVAGNIGFGIRHLSRSERNTRISDLLDLVGLTGFEGRRIATLSGGQQQRVALARALAPQPKLLLLDEPLSALDRSLREQLAREVRQVVKSLGLAAIYVTHDQDEALAVADRILVMQDGWVLRDAKPAEVWRDPQFTEVAQFLGFPLILGADLAAQWGFCISEGGVAFAPKAFRVVGLTHSPAERNTLEVFEKLERNTLEVFEKLERNTPRSVENQERNTPSVRVYADVVAYRVGRGQVELTLVGPGEQEFVVAGELGLLEQLEAHFGVLRFGENGLTDGESGVLRFGGGVVEKSGGKLWVELEIDSQGVCFVTDVSFH